MALLKKQGLWPEPVAYNCLPNWVFLTGKRCCLLPFWVLCFVTNTLNASEKPKISTQKQAFPFVEIVFSLIIGK